MDDVRKWIYGTLIAFIVVVLGFVSFIYINACGFTTSCNQGALLVERTSIPTLIPATLPMRDISKAETFNKCQIAAVDLIGAWDSSGYPEKDAFQFTDVSGLTCKATFAEDVQPLFLESNLWYPGSLACASCHQPDLAKALQNMDLSSYAGILAGSGRANGEPKWKDILGGWNWEQALLYQMLYAPDGKTTIGRPPMPLGRPADVPANGPLVFAGQPLTSASVETTLLEVTPTAEATLPARSSSVTPTP